MKLKQHGEWILQKAMAENANYFIDKEGPKSYTMSEVNTLG
jgi:hypothetical protein